jgi:hypothetical protein
MDVSDDYCHHETLEDHCIQLQHNQPSPTMAPLKKEKQLIIHCTHEKRLVSLKRDMHDIYHDVFVDTPLADLKLIVGTRNRRDARNDLIRKRPPRRLLRNEPKKRKPRKLHSKQEPVLQYTIADTNVATDEIKNTETTTTLGPDDTTHD